MDFKMDMLYGRQFPKNQTCAERIRLIQMEIGQKREAAVELEKELCQLFAHWNAVPVLKLQSFPKEMETYVGHPIRPFVIYEVNEKDFGINPDSHDAIHSKNISGPGISCGLLSDILEVISIRRRCGVQMTSDLKTSFRDSHLTTVQEFLGLGIWHKAINVMRTTKATSSGRDIDWKFESLEGTILLEVKFRRTDWRRGHPETQTFNMKNLFADIAFKFSHAMKGVLRVAHVALVKPLDQDILTAANDFLVNQPIDAIILTSIDRNQVAVCGHARERVLREIGKPRIFLAPQVMPIMYARPSIK